MTQHIRVTKSGHVSYWYNNRIGETFEVKEKKDQIFYVIASSEWEPDRTIWGIHSWDCELVTPAPAVTALDDPMVRKAARHILGMRATSETMSYAELETRYADIIAAAISPLVERARMADEFQKVVTTQLGYLQSLEWNKPGDRLAIVQDAVTVIRSAMKGS